MEIRALHPYYFLPIRFCLRISPLLGLRSSPADIWVSDRYCAVR
jgi:hypothetical protein